MKKTDGHNMKGKGNKDQFDFNTEISFARQECQHQILRGNIEDLSANLTSVATKLKERNKLIKLANQLSNCQWDGLLYRNMNKTPWQVILTMHKKIRLVEQRAIRKRKINPAPQFYTVILIHNL